MRLDGRLAHHASARRSAPLAVRRRPALPGEPPPPPARSGARARRLSDTEGERIDIVVDANGRLRLRGGDAGPRWTENSDPGFVRKNSTDFLHEFRVAYVNRQLDDAGPATFDGRPAEAFRVKQPDGITEETWYVDPQTAQPLGDVRRFADVAGEPGQVVTRRLATYEKLPPTADNLKLLSVR